MASKRLPFILSSSSHLIFNRSALSQVNNPLNVRVFFTFGGFGEGGKEKPEDNTQSKGVEVSWALCAVPRKGLESRENLCASQRDTRISLPSLAASKRSLGAEGRGEGGGIESVPAARRKPSAIATRSARRLRAWVGPVDRNPTRSVTDVGIRAPPCRLRSSTSARTDRQALSHKHTTEKDTMVSCHAAFPRFARPRSERERFG